MDEVERNSALINKLMSQLNSFEPPPEEAHPPLAALQAAFVGATAAMVRRETKGIASEDEPQDEAPDDRDARVRTASEGDAALRKVASQIEEFTNLPGAARLPPPVLTAAIAPKQGICSDAELDACAAARLSNSPPQQTRQTVPLLQKPPEAKDSQQTERLRD